MNLEYDKFLPVFLDQILNISFTCSLSCFVLNYNYTSAAELGFELSMMDPSLVGGGNLSKSCSARDFDPSVHSFVTEVCTCT